MNPWFWVGSQIAHPESSVFLPQGNLPMAFHKSPPYKSRLAIRQYGQFSIYRYLLSYF